MAGMKTLVNRTGYPLEVTLVVRKGDHPAAEAARVTVQLAAKDDAATEQDESVREVAYGNAVDIYLNGILTRLTTDGGALDQQHLVIDRGSPLDRELNTNDTLDFLFDGQTVLVSARNADQQGLTFPAEHQEA